MTPQEIIHECRKYDDRLTALGPTAKALGWRDQAQQDLRFAILTEIGDLPGSSILDIGCGFGDLRRFLEERGTLVDYTGIDINENLLTVARQRHPECCFERCNLLTDRWHPDCYDYIFASGLFNAKIGDNETFAQAMITEMFRRCRRGVAVNLMSSYVDYREAHLHYFSPEAYFALGKRLTRHLTLRHDYPLYEFTLYLLRQPAGATPPGGSGP